MRTDHVGLAQAADAVHVYVHVNHVGHACKRHAVSLNIF